MGPLANAQTISDDPVDVLDGIYHCIRTEMHGDLTGSNPLARATALCAMRRALENLVGSGYTEFLPLLSNLRIGLDRIVQAARRELVRSLLSPMTSDEEAGQIIQCLVELIEAGAWPNWKQEFNAAVERCRIR
jgi:hypothetical protein